jgi:hypothetical protein
MTQVKQRAFEMLKNISDEKAVYVIKFIRAIDDDVGAENEIAGQNDNHSERLAERQAAFDGFMQYAGRLPSDFDYKKELAEYREERYGNSARYYCDH